MVEAADSDILRSRRKAISVLFPYAVHLARRGQREMLDAFSRVARASDSWHFMWHHLKPFTMTLFDKPNPPSLNWVLGLISPSAVAWPAVAPSYTEEVDRSMVDEVLRLAFITPGPPTGTEIPTIRQVRALGDTGILRSYLLLLWSEWYDLEYRHEYFAEMQTSIREDFGGIEIWRHREDLIKCLDQVLTRLDYRKRQEQFRFAVRFVSHIETRMEPYGELKRLLLEVDGAAEKILTRTPPWLIHLGLLI